MNNGSKTIVVVENYRGFDIVHNTYGGYTEATNFFQIYKGKYLFSGMCMATVEACKRVIDTYLKRNLAD